MVCHYNNYKSLTQIHENQNEKIDCHLEKNVEATSCAHDAPGCPASCLWLRSSAASSLVSGHWPGPPGLGSDAWPWPAPASDWSGPGHPGLWLAARARVTALVAAMNGEHSQAPSHCEAVEAVKSCRVEETCQYIMIVVTCNFTTVFGLQINKPLYKEAFLA